MTLNAICALIVLGLLALQACPTDAADVLVAVRNALNSSIGVALNVSADLSQWQMFNLSELAPGALSAFVPISLPQNATAATVVPIVTQNNLALSLSSLVLTAGTYEAVVLWEPQNKKIEIATVEFDDQMPKTDVALLRVVSSAPALYVLNAISTECYQCPPQPVWTQNGETNISISSNYRTYFQLVQNASCAQNSSGCVVAETTASLVSQGLYTIVITSSNLAVFEDEIDAFAFYVPLLVAAIALAALAATAVFIVKVVLKLPAIAELLEEKPTERLLEEHAASAAPSARVASLDVFRGFTLAWMIFVNYGGGGYYFMDHASWNGLHVADHLFPWFIFIMGTAMALTYRFLDRPIAVRKLPLLWKLFRRSALLILLGLFLNNMSHTPVRLPGVLQRFGMTYWIVGLILLFVPRLKRFSVAPAPPEGDIRVEPSRTVVILQDILPYLLQWLVVLLLLAIYLVIQFALPVPNCPTGYIGPGGIGSYGMYPTCTGGAHGYIDRLIFGKSHLYQTPTAQFLYKTGAFDPEGALGILTSVLLAFLGVQTGRILTQFKTPRERIVRWLCWACLCGAGTLTLTLGTQNEGVIPINKNLWSPSFVTVTACFGLVVLSLFYYLVDVARLWSGAPFSFIGMNSILIYACHEVLGGYFPFKAAFNDGTHAMFLLSNLIAVGSWLIVAFRMFQLQFFVKL